MREADLRTGEADNQMILIVMTAYGHDKYLERAIAGIVCQEYQDWSMIIVDNGSTDKTAEILKEIQDPRIQVLTLKENIGFGGAVNKAILFSRMIKLDYDAFTCICDDDFYYEHWLSTLVPFLKEADLVYSAYRFCPEIGEKYSSIPKIQAEYEPNKLIMGNFIGITRIWTRKLLDKVGMFEHTACEDYDYWLRCEEKGARFKYIPIELADYLVGTNSWSYTHAKELITETQKVQERALSRRSK